MSLLWRARGELGKLEHQLAQTEGDIADLEKLGRLIAAGDLSGVVADLLRAEDKARLLRSQIVAYHAARRKRAKWLRYWRRW